jgi:cytochrome c-type biogenesis protein CcmH
MQPATPDRPLDPEAQQFAEMIGRLERVLENRPDDARGHRLLADGYARLGRHAEAWRTYETLIDILGGDAEPALHAAQAESMIRAAGGYVSPEAEAALSRALLRDPSLPIARLYQGLAQAQRGRLGQAVATWEALEADAAEDAPWRGALERMLARARDQQAGGGTIARAAPSTGGAEPGPGRADMEAAAEMSREERQAMITGMVQSLDQRLAEEGGGPEEWVRLIRARMQLGETEAAREAYRRSQEALEGSEAGFVRERALLLGVIEQ